jgi:Rieske Fe-S protein
MVASRFDSGRRRICGGLAASVALAASLPRLLGATTHRSFPSRTLVHPGPGAQPFRATELQPGRNYVFAYPYVSTPCFLLDLGEPLTEPVTLETRDGQRYRWQGGAGPNRSIVAFSAICPHRMTHPAPSVSFISYRPSPSGPPGEGIIKCCSENSRFDPRRGARVLSGPAPEPLAAIALAYDPAGDRLTATGAYGGLLFERFLAQFEGRLALDYGPERFARLVAGDCPVYALEDYSRVNMQC